MNMVMQPTPPSIEMGLLYALALIITAIGSGLAAKLYFFSIGDPQGGEIKRQRILSWLGLWLEHKFDTRKARIEAKAEAKAMPPKPKPGEQPIRPNTRWDRPNWWKVWLCPLCFNTWWSLLTMLVMVKLVLGLSWAWMWALPLYWGFSNFALMYSSAHRRKG